MNRLVQKPFNYLWGIVPFVMAVALYLNIDSAIDLGMGDTNYVVSTFHMGVIFSMYLVFAGLLYWLFRKVTLNSWMTGIHLVLSMAMPLAVLFVVEPITKDQVSTGIANWLVIFTFVWVLAQLVFLINLVRGAILKP
jgi:hypothetical protein